MLNDGCWEFGDIESIRKVYDATKGFRVYREEALQCPDAAHLLLALSDADVFLLTLT